MADRTNAPAPAKRPEPAPEPAPAPEPLLYCPNCSRRLQERGCKLRCPACGYYLSCSDYV